jgi:hypothetical protein
MDIKEYLLTDKSIHKSELAALIWPEKQFPEVYLQQILSGIHPFTKDDAIRAYNALQQLAAKYNSLSLEGDYPYS